MSDTAFKLGEEFPPVSYEQWRDVVEKDLAGAPFDKKLVTHTYEGIDVQPVYTLSDATTRNELPGFPPFTRGARPLGAVVTGWDLRPEFAHPDLAATNRAILDDLSGGAQSALLKFDAAVRQGLDPDAEAASELAGVDGVMVYSAGDLSQVLADVDLAEVPIQLQAGAAFAPAAAMLAAVWRERNIADEDALGAFGGDPLATLAEQGRLPLDLGASLEQLGELARWTADRFPKVASVGVDTTPYHLAGATAVQDIAFSVATATEYLRALVAAGLSVDAAARQFLFTFSLGTHHFLALAKLRAARRLWSRVVEASGGASGGGAMRIHARTSERVLTQRDPYVNLLRNTAAMFAAGLGGAEATTSLPLDALTGHPQDFSRRVARNTVLIMQEEGHLNRVVDPAGGSWFLERLTDQMAESAWNVFRDVERQGGMCKALEGGWVAAQIDSAYAPRAKDIARRKDGITGVSEFPNVAEEKLVGPEPDLTALRQSAKQRIAAARNAGSVADESASISDLATAAAAGSTIGQLSQRRGRPEGGVEIAPIPAHSFAEPFEQLRDASDAWQETHGSRPRVFLAAMGPVAHYTARATYAKNFFEAGGFEAILGEGLDDASAAASFSESGASIAVICSSDKLYPDVVPPLAEALKSAGARTVVLAGYPGDNENAWRAAGVDRFIFIKCDVLAILRDLLTEEGVLAS